MIRRPFRRASRRADDEPPVDEAPVDEAPVDEAPVDEAPVDEARATTWRQALSIALATGAYGVSFGALATAAGLTVAQACALSLLMFSGGSQFALIGVVGAGGGAISAVATAGLLGIRNSLYGLQLSRLLAPRGVTGAAAVQLTIDESTAVATGREVLSPGRPELARLGFWVTGAGIYLFWNLMTLVGALLGDAAGDPRTYGLDAAAAAAFLALLWPRLKDASAARAALAAAVVAAALVPAVPAGLPVLAAAAAALAVALLTGRRAGADSTREAGR